MGKIYGSILEKVGGKIIQKRFEESYFGMMEINTILTDKGIECERYGKVPTIEQKDYQDYLTF